MRIENGAPPVEIELLPSMTPRQKAGSPLVGDQKSHDGPCRRVRSARRARLEPCGRDSHFFRVQSTLVPIRACCEIVWAIASNEVFRISPSCLAQKVPLLEQKLSLGSVELQVRGEAHTPMKEAKLADPNPLSETVRDSILAVDVLCAENLRLKDQVKLLGRSNLVFETELQSLKLAVEAERNERRQYQSVCDEIMNGLEVVGRAVEEVVRQAEQEVSRQRRENPRCELPDLKAPTFLQRLEAVLSGAPKDPTASVDRRAGS